MSNDELHNYLSYLQKCLVSESEDIAPVFDHVLRRKWYESNGDRLKALASLHSVIASDLQEATIEFEPRLPLDIAESQLIFEPLRAEVLQTARNLGCGPTREVYLATSPELAWNGATVPSDHQHIVFLGPGMSVFCNYWAKVFTALIRGVAGFDATQRMSLPVLQECWRANPNPLILATRLALHCGLCDTAVGFGEIVQPRNYLSYRLQLLRSMELFVMAHEIAHCYAQETGLDSQDPIALELACDQFAIQITRHCQSESENWLTFTGAAPLLLFASHRICRDARDIVRPSGMIRTRTHSHPDSETRIQALFQTISRNTPPDQAPAAISFFVEMQTMAQIVNEEITELLRSAMSSR